MPLPPWSTLVPTHMRVRVSREVQNSQHSQSHGANISQLRSFKIPTSKEGATNYRSTSCQTVFVPSMTESAGPQQARHADDSNRAASAGSRSTVEGHRGYKLVAHITITAVYWQNLSVPTLPGGYQLHSNAFPPYFFSCHVQDGKTNSCALSTTRYS
jgi:hypothetical protein